MSIFVLLLLTVIVFGTALMIWELKEAPEGYQDEEGFHVVWRNNAMHTRDVCCVWLDGADDGMPQSA